MAPIDVMSYCDMRNFIIIPHSPQLNCFPILHFNYENQTVKSGYWFLAECSQSDITIRCNWASSWDIQTFKRAHLYFMSWLKSLGFLFSSDPFFKAATSDFNVLIKQKGLHQHIPVEENLDTVHVTFHIILCSLWIKRHCFCIQAWLQE